MLSQLAGWQLYGCRSGWQAACCACVWVNLCTHLFILQNKLVNITNPSAARHINEDNVELHTSPSSKLQNAVEVPGFYLVEGEIGLLLMADGSFGHLAGALVYANCLQPHMLQVSIYVQLL